MRDVISPLVEIYLKVWVFFLQVLELLQEAGDEGFDTMCLLQTLGQVKTDVLDSKKTCSSGKKENEKAE